MGGRGINCAHSPTPRDYYALNDVQKPPLEGERSVRATEDPHLGRGLGVAGPGLRRRPVARVRWQDFLATWPAFPPTRNGDFLKTARTSKAGPSG